MRAQLLVIASIHQPSTSTFYLFDKLLLISAGRTCYYGRVEEVQAYFDSLGFPVPMMTNPAEYILEQSNIDFARDREAARLRLQELQRSWARSSEAAAVVDEINGGKSKKEDVEQSFNFENFSRSNRFLVPITLLHRSFVKSYRDVVAYGIRIAMYTGKSYAGV